MEPGLIVTNAHVVAGENHTQVQVDGIGPDLAGEVVGFDVHDDIALLRVPGLNCGRCRSRPRPRRDLGRDSRLSADGPFNAQAGRIGQTGTVRTQNAYGQGDVTRSITPLRGRSDRETRAGR